MAANSEVEMASTSTQIILSNRVLKVPSCHVGQQFYSNTATYARCYTRNIWGAHHTVCTGNGPVSVTPCKQPHCKNFIVYAQWKSSCLMGG
jgi:hypothetical protein